jgi:hypothetical protein
VRVSPSSFRAIEWIERQLADMNGIRNATSRDPIFKNWRQATLTTLQRIWPGERAHLERFLRIPFSPVDPHTDARTLREVYARGCQEAAKVLKGYIEEVRAKGVPDLPDSDISGAGPSSGEFQVDFPTVDFPEGDLGSAALSPRESQNPLAEFVDSAPQVSDARIPPPPPPTGGIPTGATPAGVPVTEPRPAKKGLNMRARLRDLLGFAQLSAKAFSSPPRETPSSASIPSLDLPASQGTPLRRELDIVPIGEAVVPPAPPAPPAPAVPPPAEMPEPAAVEPEATPVEMPEPVAASAESEPAPAPEPEPEVAEAREADLPPAAPVAPTDQNAVPYEPGRSVVMSRPTTLRGSIEKVSIESLISEQFRGGTPGAGATAATPAAATPATPATTAAPVPATPAAPARSATPAPTPVAGAPATPAPPAPPKPVATTHASVPPAPPKPARPADATRPAAAPHDPELPHSRVMPIPKREEVAEFEPGAPVEELLASAAGAPPSVPDEADEEEVATPPPPTRSKIVPLPTRRGQRQEPEHADENPDSAVGRVDPEAFARATEDFMRSSPVLGATGRRVKRGRDRERAPERGREPARERDRDREQSGYQDPDAIAVASMLDDLASLGVPASRHQESRARLKDLAGRLERADLDWGVLRKAVWFAMEYPELARRLVPVLLPWFDRAA